MVSIPLQQLKRERDIDLTRYITMTYFNLIEKLSSKIVMEDLGKSLLNHYCPTNPNNDHNYPITITFQTEWDDRDPGKGTMKKSTRTHNAATTEYFNSYSNRKSNTNVTLMSKVDNFCKCTKIISQNRGIILF